MNVIQTIAITISVALGVILVIYKLLPYLIQKGINVSGILDKTGKALDAAETVNVTLSNLMPENKAFGIVQKVIDYAQEGVMAAEQLYLTSQLDGTDRKKRATELVYAGLVLSGVEINDELKMVVDGAIEAAVYTLPKTHPIEESDVDENLIEI